MTFSQGTASTGGKYALKAGERFEMHSPRHSLVTYSVSHGADPMAVQGLLRHSNVHMAL
jgi:site-specific recombinase XerD